MVESSTNYGYSARVCAAHFALSFFVSLALDTRSRYRFDIFSGHVDPPRGQTSFRADVLMTSISSLSLFFDDFLAKSAIDRPTSQVALKSEREQR